MEEKRNGNFVCKQLQTFDDVLKNEVSTLVENLKGMYPDIDITLDYGGKNKSAEIRIFFNLKPVNFKVTGEGEYMVKENPYILIRIYNEYGYKNDPFVSNDYETTENQLSMWIVANNFKFRPRYKREFSTWEPDRHFDYAYHINTLYEETIIPALEQFDSIIRNINN